ncbi:MAG: DUF4271 domain-containing protein [Saprospiraceae bacterium]|nr:DUF4271 domain-containing protein [Saprospiraceae bacterium]
MKQPILISCLILIGQLEFLAQTTQNPFEMNHRLESSENAVSSIDPPGNEVAKQVDTSNPFEIRSRNKISEPEPTKPIPEVPVIDVDRGIGLGPNALFWFLIFLTLLFAVIINLNRTIVNNLLKAWGNLNFSNLLLREKKEPDQLLYTLLAILFYSNAGLFIGLILDRFFNYELTLNRLLLYIGGVATVYVVRHVSLMWLANTFSFKKESRQYSFTIHLFNILNGILLLFANYIVVFAPEVVGTTLIYITIILLGLQFIYRNIRGLLLGGKYIVSHRMHFFLYLCTCEIVPWIVCIVTISRMG